MYYIFNSAFCHASSLTFHYADKLTCTAEPPPCKNMLMSPRQRTHTHTHRSCVAPNQYIYLQLGHFSLQTKHTSQPLTMPLLSSSAELKQWTNNLHSPPHTHTRHVQTLYKETRQMRSDTVLISPTAACLPGLNAFVIYSLFSLVSVRRKSRRVVIN